MHNTCHFHQHPSLVSSPGQGREETEPTLRTMPGQVANLVLFFDLSEPPPRPGPWLGRVRTR
ncbi:hypothetical protein CGRA01v4_00857 [Colletotrichum graminicola]|nr:hypothetical protein CGRA01v4_00857 [Colletotrichum graminicola]